VATIGVSPVVVIEIQRSWCSTNLECNKPTFCQM